MPSRDSIERPALLVTNAEERSVLAACRDLHEAGYRVTAASHTALAPAQWSRACSRRVRIADPRRDAEGFIAQLGAELSRRRYAALLPGSDGALLAISLGREHLPGAATGLPPHPIIERVLSRMHLDEAARAAGFMVLPAIRCASTEEALDSARELGYPVVLKSADTAHSAGGTVTGAAKGRVIRGESELRCEAPDFRGELLLQPFVAGEAVSFGGAVGAGQLLAAAMTRYLRMWPPNGGSVAFGETIAIPPAIEERVARLVQTLQWEGIFELELIQTPSGIAAIDFNPRPYGSMALASAAGAPLAAIWCDWLLGRTADDVGAGMPRARAGLRYRWEDGDLRYLAIQARRRHLRAALAAIRPDRGVVHAHWRKSDPLPMLVRMAYLAKRVASD